MLEENSYADLF